ncbi:uncharacterized protein LOC107844964 [Capsicum annuum]|uniref:uncharacterized protein LOC107844964 n=1 Tax=Capsicum annuum TaxID=4072 RepID=UPI001FB0D8C6|nr:uncharacterized protein LOC107844964 [Capsicum annuum]
MKRCSHLYSAAIYYRMHSYYMFASILPKIPNIQGQQIRAAVYEDDIAYYADKLVLLNTYLISAARVKDSPKSYARTIHTFYWILDKETIVERINPNDEIEKPLPPPTKLNLTPLANVAQLTPIPSTENGRTQNRCRNITIANDHCESEKVLPLTIDQRIPKKVRPLATSEKKMEPTIVKSESSSAALALEWSR